MSLLVRTPGLFPTRPSFFSDFFDNDDKWLDFDGNGWTSKIPAANIQEKDAAYVIELAAPGMEKEDFHVDVENGNLCISSEKESETEGKENGYSRKEFSYSSFSRSFALPENVKEDKIKASYKDGILSLTLPKEKDVKIPKKEIKIS
ncbi:MAG: Hsp20/alpha crystallin family protein [Cyclobacteriaceae bacterium]